MNVVIQLLNNKDVSQQVKKKILQLIQHWGLRFEDDSDVLPLFSNVYTALKSKNLPFADENEARQAVRQLKDALEGKAAMPDNKPLDKKHSKLKKDLEVVIGNIVLTNEMIDAHDVDQEVDTNDALISLVQSLVSFENKILEIIGKIKNDTVMHIALTTNDDLQRTMKRYKKLEHGRVPEKFKPECRKFLPDYRDTPPKSSKKAEEPARKPETKPKFVEKAPEPVRSKPPVQDIFGEEDEIVVNIKPAARAAPVAAAKPSADDIFGLDFSDTPTTTSSAPKKDAGGSNVSLLNDIMTKMTLNKQSEMNQFSTAAPGGGGFGMPPMGAPMGGPMGGPMGAPMGGPMGGPNPNMFFTGMPPPHTGGYNPGPSNFFTGAPGGGMGGGPMGGSVFGGGFNQPTGF